MAAPKKSALLGGGSTAYEAASRTSVELGAYNPPTRSPDAALLERRELVAARTRDMERNSGLVFSAVERKTDSVVGADSRPQIKPNWRALGITQEQARDFSQQAEAWWDVFANDPGHFIDAGRRMSFGQMARVLYWHWLVDGQSCNVPMWLPRFGSTFGTAFMPIDPRRLSNPDTRPDSRFMRGGQEIDRYGAPVAFHVREQNPGDILDASTSSNRWERIPAFTRWGRRRFIHGFVPRQAEQTQGRSPFLPVLKKVRMFEKRDDLELQAAANLAAFAMFIKSQVPSEALFQMMTEAPTGSETLPGEQVANFMEFAADYYGRNAYTVNGTKVAHLLPNEEIGSVSMERAGADFVVSQQQWMRYFGWALGMPYEQISGDFSKSAYVGIQAGFNEAWKTVMADRSMFGMSTLTPMLDLFMEEAIATGRVALPEGAPTYDEARAAWIGNTIWIGPGRGAVDPVKAANAQRIRMETGATTLEMELAEDGIDPEDHIAQLGREEDMRKAAGLPSIFPTVGASHVVEPETPEEPGYEPGGDA